MGQFRVTVFQGGAEVENFTFDKNVVTIGRSPESDVRIQSKTVSRQQAELLRTSQGFAMFAHNSTNVTKVRGEKVPPEGSVPLEPGDPIKIADRFDLTLELIGSPTIPEPEDDDSTPLATPREPEPGPEPDPRPAPAPPPKPRRTQHPTAAVEPSPLAEAPPPAPARPAPAESEAPPPPPKRQAQTQRAPGRRPPPAGQRPRPTRRAPAAPPPAGGSAPILGQTHGAPVPIPPPVKVEVVASARQRQGPAGARLLCRLNGSERAFEVHDDFYVGGGEDSDLCLSGGYAPRRAALLVKVDGRYRVYNTSPLAETVLVNGKGIQGHADLVDGDELSVYGVALTFEAS